MQRVRERRTAVGDGREGGIPHGREVLGVIVETVAPQRMPKRKNCRHTQKRFEKMSSLGCRLHVVPDRENDMAGTVAARANVKPRLSMARHGDGVAQH